MRQLRSALAIAICLVTAATHVQAQNYKFFDNAEYAIIAVPTGGTIEPPIPVQFNGSPLNNPATPGPDTFEILELWDRVPGTSSYPLVGADIIASGYVRPLVQKAGGGGGGIGTSIIVGPSFRALGAPLDLIPEMSSASVIIGGPDRFTIQTQGVYGTKAKLTGMRGYPDPAPGTTIIRASYTFEVLQAITLPSDSKGKGFDAFRFLMLSSMLADLSAGEYDANFLAITNPAGQTKTVALNDQPRNIHLYASPQPTAIGRSIALLKDKQSTWNPESPTVEIALTSLSRNNGPAPTVGVQGYLAGSTNPNDDSLNIWLEWIDAPTTIPAGTIITAAFDIIATHPTDRGDLNHDQAFTCDDHPLLSNLLGQTPASPTFDAYADLNKDNTISEADRQALLSKITSLQADCDQSGALAIDDFICFQTLFALGDPYADFDGDGLLTIDDFITFQTVFSLGGCF